MNTKDIISALDVAVLKPTDTLEYALEIAEAGKKLGFASVCVRPDYVHYVAEVLYGSSCKVCTVIGFPFGYGPTTNKLREVGEATRNGATEFDMVMNLGYFKAKDYGKVEADIARVASVLRPKDRLKVILETCLWSPEEIALACQIAEMAGADWVKTSTGFSTGGATREAVKVMMTTVGHRIGVKASGGIKCREMAENYLKMGCSRLGVGADSYANVIQDFYDY